MLQEFEWQPNNEKEKSQVEYGKRIEKAGLVNRIKCMGYLPIGEIILPEQQADLLLSLVFNPQLSDSFIQMMGLISQGDKNSEWLAKRSVAAKKSVDREVLAKINNPYLQSNLAAISIDPEELPESNFLGDTFSASDQKSHFTTLCALTRLSLTDNTEIYHTLKGFPPESPIMEKMIEERISLNEIIKTHLATVNRHLIEKVHSNRIAPLQIRPSDRTSLLPICLGAFSTQQFPNLLLASYAVLHDLNFIPGLSPEQKKLLIQKFKEEHETQSQQLLEKQDQEGNRPYQLIEESNKRNTASPFINRLIARYEKTIDQPTDEINTEKFKEVINRINQAGGMMLIPTDLLPDIPRLIVSTQESTNALDFIVWSNEAAFALQTLEFELQGVTTNYTGDISGLKSTLLDTVYTQLAPEKTENKEKHRKWKWHTNARTDDEKRFLEYAKRMNRREGTNSMSHLSYHDEGIHIIYDGLHNERAIIVDSRKEQPDAWQIPTETVPEILQKINPLPPDFNK